MNIRKATIEDLDSILGLYLQLSSEPPVLGQENAKEILNKIIDSNYFMIFVGCENKRIVTTCYFNLIPNLTKNGSSYAIIENVVTDATYRNKGFGKAIIKYALDYAWSNGCYKVMLQTGSKKKSTHEFYKTNGFDGNDKIAFVARPHN